jgi:hypothetical protein
MSRIFTQSEDSPSPELTESRWELARAFFDERKVKRADLGGAGDWNGWSDELDEASIQTTPMPDQPMIRLCF